MPSASYSWEQSVGRPLIAPQAQSAWSMRWWILLAIMTSSAIHLGLFFVLGDLKLPGATATEDAAAVVEDVRFEDRIQLDPKLLEQTLAAPEIMPENTVETEMTTELPPVDQIIEHIKGDITFSPETTTITNVQMSTRKQGETGSAVDAVSAVDTALAGGIEKKIQTSSSSEMLKTAKAQDDQVTIKVTEKPLSTGDTLGELATARKKGDDGLRGLGFSTLDDLMDIKTPKTGDLKAMMPSDLLFDYNSADVKESARLDLMKLGFLIQTWTKSMVIVEGHTDTTGDENYNQGLSLRRAEAVKSFVVDSLKIDGSRIQTRGLGETQPIADGNASQEEQAINRRVVIRFVNP